MLKVREITKIYKKNNIIANSNITFNVNKGEMVCILGQNGAGKSTLIKVLCGLNKATSGHATLNEENLLKSRKLINEKVGAVLEGSRNIYYYMTIIENIEYFGRLNKIDKSEIRKRANYYLRLFKLSDRINSLVRTLSRGMQQKVAIIIALIKNPEVLLLDEPTLGLDITSSIQMVDILEELRKKENMIIIITTHDVRLIENLNCRIIFIKDGKLIKDTSYIELQKEFEKVKFIVEIRNKAKVNQYKIVKRDNYKTTIEVDDLKEVIRTISSSNILSIKRNDLTFEEMYKIVME